MVPQSAHASHSLSVIHPAAVLFIHLAGRCWGKELMCDTEILHSYFRFAFHSQSLLKIWSENTVSTRVSLCVSVCEYVSVCVCLYVFVCVWLCLFVSGRHVRVCVCLMCQNENTFPDKAHDRMYLASSEECTKWPCPHCSGSSWSSSSSATRTASRMPATRGICVASRWITKSSLIE